jgi:hypothetical protein
VFKALSIGNVIDGYTTLRVPVISLRDGSEAFLPSSVPDLYLDDSIVVDLYCPCLEVHSNCAKVVISEEVF